MTAFSAPPRRPAPWEHLNRIPSLDGLRALSIILVLLGHSLKQDGYPQWLKWAGGQSAIGVEIFFVISGFLITSLLMKEMRMHGRIDLRDF